MNLIVKMKFGAHLYGTATDRSDVDYKGVYLPSRQEILLGRIPKCRNFTTGDRLSKNTLCDIDEEIYSLHYFIQLAIQGQTVAIDMLHAPEDAWMVHTDIWREIVKQRHRFYTKSLRSFVDYARRQAAKYGIKGSRLNAAAQVMALLKSKNPDHKLRRVWDELPRIEHCRDRAPDPHGMRQYEVCGKVFQESARIGYVHSILKKFYNEYGARAKLAAQNKNIDWKAISHALRAAIQTREILMQNTIHYPLRDALFLKRVKAGRLDYAAEAAPALEALMDEVEQLIDNSSMPEQVDTEYWDRFICDTLERNIFQMR